VVYCVCCCPFVLCSAVMLVLDMLLLHTGVYISNMYIRKYLFHPRVVNILNNVLNYIVETDASDTCENRLDKR